MKKRKTVQIDVEKLIELVRCRPSLYDKKHRDYKDKQKAAITWLRIAQECGVSATAATTRWEGLRNNYRKHQKKIKGKTGQALKRITPYIWYGNLTWLEPHVGTRR